MKKLYTLLCIGSIISCCATLLPAQIPNTSTIPVDVFFEVPSTGLSRTIGDYTSASNSTEWGIQPLRQTVSAEVVWVRDDVGMDTLGCDTSSISYEGKMALVRRGACFFSDKVYYAQQAGAIAAVIVNADGSDPTGGMAAGDDKALDITIPAIFINDPDEAAGFIALLDAGETVIGTFQVRGFFGELGPIAYATPQDQVLPLTDIQVDLLNLDPDNEVVDINATVDIIPPSGNNVKLTASVGAIAPDAIHTFEFDAFAPEEVGLYEILYSNSLTADTLVRRFEVTEHTFQMDNGNIPEWPTDSWIAPTEESFLEDLLVYDFGNVFRTNAAGGTATYATFSLGNPDALFTGFSDADMFSLLLFDTDPEGLNNGPLGTETDYSTFELVGIGFYSLTGDENPYDLLTVAFEEPVALKPNGHYLLMAAYNGVNAALGIPPWYTYAGQESYPGVSTMVFSDRLYTGGWAGDFRAVVRLHLEGYTPPVSTVQQGLAENKARIMPNPANEVLNLELALEQAAEKVTFTMVDLYGKVLKREVYQGVQAGTFSFNTAGLSAGTYFLAIQTPEGFVAKRFVVMH